jgi:Outer membrane protein beta-barrel family
MIWNDGGDDFARGQGLPVATTGGLSYINKWNKDKNSVNGSYQFNDQTVTGINGTITQTILENSSFTNTTSETFNTYRRRHKLNTLYDWNIDSSSSLKLKANGAVVTGQRENIFNGRSTDDNGELINEQSRSINTDIENRDFTSELSYRKRLKKAGRTISYTGNYSNNVRLGDGFLFSNNKFYDNNGQLTNEDDIDQKKTNNERQQTIQNSIIYTEPISKTWNLELTYRNNFSRNNAERNTFERPTLNDNYKDIVDTLSNHFLFRTTDHNGGVSFRYNGKKIVASFGTAVGRTNFKLEELNKGDVRSIAFTNLLPRASIRFTPKKQKSFTLSYNGSTQNPTLQQINPIIDNIDPLNITIGNPDLKQAFRHNFSLNMNDYKIIKSRNFYLSGNFSFVNNAITNSNTLNIQTGERTNKTINTNGNYNGGVWTMYGFEVFKGVNLHFNASGNVSRFVNEVNNVRNVSDNYSIGAGIGLGKWSDKWLNFNINVEPMYNSSRSSINKGIVTKYWSVNAYPYIETKFKKQKLYVNINGELNFYQKTSTFANQRNVFLLNSSIRRTFGKTEAFELKASVNDMFNQNLGIRRNITSNFISENTFQNIRRFWLLTFTWNFTKNGSPSNF